jgi:cyclomaltodextrinase / maltogenic alpha-amylase / neopullulanase
VPIDTPGWVRDTVFYQVFPDRFAASDRVVKPGPLEPWDAPPTQAGYKGGDLLGLTERLDELVDLGISGLYLNPIFSATSNHRYNAYDYLEVDPLLGGDAAFRELLDGAHARGIRVMLDGVFNHSGRGFWPFQHVIEAGLVSPYRDWFYLDGDVLDGQRGIDAYPIGWRDGTHVRTGYRAWWGIPSLPKLRVENPAVREYLFGVAEHWLRFGIDGWRLDVPEEIEDESFWPEFRARVRAVNPEAYLLGEIWEEAPEWLRGDRFDAVMNYPLGLAILGFVGASQLDASVIAGQANYARDLVSLDGAEFGRRVEGLMGLYDPAVTAIQFNLIGSHDTPRARTVMGGDANCLRLATLLQLTLPGAPSIYYGDELAMEGRADPDCRRAYPTTLDGAGAEGLATRALVKALVAARSRHVALRRGKVRVIAAGTRAVVMGREAEGRRALVGVNAGADPVTLQLAADGAGAGADGLRPLELPNVTKGSIVEGGMAVNMPAQSALVLVDD